MEIGKKVKRFKKDSAGIEYENSEIYAELDRLSDELKGDAIELDGSYECFFTGNPLLDALVGAEGLPKNQLEFIWAASSVGKSTLVGQILSSYIKQHEKSIILYFDTEQSLTKERLLSLGIKENDIKRRIKVFYPKSVEDVYAKILETRSKLPPDYDMFAVWDTITNTPSKEEAEVDLKKAGETGRMLTQAKSITTAFRKLDFFKLKLTMIAVAQYRDDISGRPYVVEEPSGCNSVKHKAYVALYGTKKKVTFVDKVKVNGNEYDINNSCFIATLNVYKSKVAAPKGKLDFVVSYNCGYDAPLTLINFLIDKKIIVKKVGRYYFNSEPDVLYRLFDLYKYLLTDEAVSKWKMTIDYIFNHIYPIGDKRVLNEKKTNIINYYFEGDKFNIDRFTSVYNLEREDTFLGRDMPSISDEDMEDMESSMEEIEL